LNAQRRGRTGQRLFRRTGARSAKTTPTLLTKLKRWVETDYNSKGQVNWRREAREDFNFEAGVSNKFWTIALASGRPSILLFDQWRYRDCEHIGSGHSLGGILRARGFARRQ
jgi:hypothetical protein